MKPLLKISYLLVLMLIDYSCAVQQKQQTYNQERPVDFQVFYDELSPYGNWVNYSNYGYIWIPDVRREFAPYSTNGNWVMTEYGWTWVSDYRWGWAPFHYGRWDYDDYYGWFWVPDNQWGPAWVTWRSGNGYYGWAPLRPGMNINNGFNDSYRDINRWNFVRDRDFGKRDLDRYYVNRGNYSSILNNSTVINNTSVDRRRNTTYIAGPEADNVQRATGRNVNRVRIQDNDRPGQKLANDELKIYRPEVQRTANRQAAPAKVADKEDVKPLSERGTGNSRRNINPFESDRNTQMPERNQQTERRRTRQQTEQQQQIEKTGRIPQAQTSEPDITTPQEPSLNEQRRIERQGRLRNQQIERQERQMQQNQTGMNERQTTPPPSTSEAKEILQEQKARQDITKQEKLAKEQQLQVERQQQQVIRQQQQLERQQQQQRRRQERQEMRQQQQMEKSGQVPQAQPTQQQNEQEQRNTAPSGSRRR